MLIAPLTSFGFKLGLLRLKIPPGVISSKKGNSSLFHHPIGLEKAAEVTKLHILCLYDKQGFSWNTLLDSRVTKMKSYISANWCNYSLVSRTMLRLHYIPVLFFYLKTLGKQSSVSLFIPQKHSRLREETVKWMDCCYKWSVPEAGLKVMNFWIC